MQFLFITLGSTGDILPFLELSRELDRRGHQCRLITQEAFQDLAKDYPVSWTPLFTSPLLNDLEGMMLEIFRRKRGSEVVDYFYNILMQDIVPRRDELLKAIDQADVVLGSYLFPFFTLIARKRGKPAWTISFSHRFFPSSNHNPLLETRKWRLPLNAWSWKFFYYYINRKMRQHLRSAGLLEELPAQYQMRDEYVLNSFLCLPSVFKQNQENPGEPAHWIGALRSTTQTSALEPEIENFLREGPIPLLNFGSVNFDDVEKVLESFLRHWPEDRRILVQSGWAGLMRENAPDNIKFLGRVSHDALFPRLSLLIHHGGAGTTAAALHAGIPQIIVPHIADQWFFGDEVNRLGVGQVLARQQWPQKLPPLVAQMETDAKLRVKAQGVAAQLKAERGIVNLADTLEAKLSSSPST